MAKGKIAPTLQTQITALTGTTGDRARAELRALLRSHRLMEKAWRELPTGHPLLKPMARALARLDRVSGAREGTP